MEAIIKISILLLFAMNSCTNDIKWEVQLVDSENKYVLTNTFISKKSLKMIFDRKAFSYNCYYGENYSFENKKNYSPSDFKHSQIVIENKKGDKRLYSNVYFEVDEIKDLPDVNCMSDWFEYLSFSKTKGKEVLNIDIAYLSDLKVTDTDKEVRLHYLFKVNKEQEKEGYSSLILSSNWLKIPR